MNTPYTIGQANWAPAPPVSTHGQCRRSRLAAIILKLRDRRDRHQRRAGSYAYTASLLARVSAKHKLAIANLLLLPERSILEEEDLKVHLPNMVKVAENSMVNAERQSQAHTKTAENCRLMLATLSRELST